MPPSDPSRVFISYARKDGAALAQRLQSDLTEAGFDAWLDTQRIGCVRVWSAEIEDAIKSCGVMIALMSPASYASEICRSEQLLALDNGNRVIPLLAIKSADRPLYLYARQYRDFTDGSDYPGRLGELLADIRGDATATLPDTYRKTRITYLTAPPRVAHYLERPEALHALRDALFAEDHRQPVALTALAGMGGIGKTVLAKALTEDEVVQRAFPDGIVWITAGKERKRDLIEEMRELAKALGDDLSGYDTALACENQYRSTIASKAALIVVDDVWSKSDIEPLLAESPRSRFLFTTRDAAIGRFVSAHEHRADLLNVAQSRELLALWANRPVAELPLAADGVIAECGQLPLALSVVGAMLRGESAEFWQDTLDLLRKADLSAIQEQLPDGQDSFFKAVEVSFQALKPEMRERYKALAVLLEGMAAPLPILETLWNVSEAEARRISRILADRSLAQRDGADESIRLHDLQLDYISAQYPDKEALELIHAGIRLSLNVIGKDPSDFASQMVGRLLSHQDVPTIEEFTKRAAQGTRKRWLRPLQPGLDRPGTGLIRTLKGHSSEVLGVALSRDAQRAISASADKTVKVWDLQTGRELWSLQGHSAAVRAVAMSWDGRLAVSASDDATLKIWDLVSGHELRTLRGHFWPVLSVAVSADGRRCVSGCHDKTMKVWDVESGRELLSLEGHFWSVHGLALRGDGRRAVSASGDHTLIVWNVEDGTRWWHSEVRTLRGHSAAVLAVALSEDGIRAVSASQDKTLKVWDVESGRELRTLAGHSWFVCGVAVTADGRCAVSASEDKTLRLWDLDSGRELRILQGHLGYVYGVVVSRDGRFAVSASADTTLKVWDLESGLDLPLPPSHSGYLDGVAVSRDGRLVVSASADTTLKVWDVESSRVLCTLQGHRLGISSVALIPNGKRAVSGSYDHTLKVWDVESGRELRTLQGHSAGVRGVAVTRDGRYAVSASEDKTLKIWDVESGAEQRCLEGHFDWVNAVAVSADGHRVVSASKDKTLKVWDLESGHELRTLSGHSKSVRAVAISEDGRYAVSAADDDTLKLWSVEDGIELRTLKGHSHTVIGVAMSLDGQRAVSASWDNTVKLWDLGTGEVLATFTCDSGALCCAFSDALNLIVAGDRGGHLHFLRVVEPKTKV